MKLVSDPSVVLVDIHESDNLTCSSKGALQVPHGLLECQADPTSPTHKPELGGGKKSSCSIAAPAAGLRWQPRL